MLGGGGRAGKEEGGRAMCWGGGAGGCELQLTAATYIYMSTGALLLDSCCSMAASSAADVRWGQLITMPKSRL
jgi:hypothetical protein